jgi:hypothetical protein
MRGRFSSGGTDEYPRNGGPRVGRRVSE